MASLFDGYSDRATVLIFTDPVSGDITEVPLDCSLNIGTSMSGSLTSFPVEERSNINDHFQPNPLTLSITGFISESPSQKLLTLATSLATGALLSTGQFQGLSAAFATALLASLASSATKSKSEFDETATFKKLLASRSETDPEYPKRAMLGLEKLFRSGEPFDVRTYFSDQIYKNMVVTSLSFTQDANSGDSLNFSITASKLTTVQSFTPIETEISMADPAGTSAAESTDKGKVTPKPPGSIVSKFVDRISGATP